MEIEKVQKTEIPLKLPLLLSKPETCSRYHSDREVHFAMLALIFFLPSPSELLLNPAW